MVYLIYLKNETSDRIYIYLFSYLCTKFVLYAFESKEIK